MMKINDLKNKFNQYKRDKRFVAVSIIVLLVIICLIAYIISYYVGLKSKEDQFAELREMQLTEVSETTEVASTEEVESNYCELVYDFDELKETNEDIYAWITVPGTQVDYPVLQSETDNYYLNHNLDHSTGYPGCIYTNPCNAKDFSDLNTVLYGHNMKNGSMFGCLHEFEDEQFFEENRLIYVYTPENRLTYEIYAAVKFSDVYIPWYYDVSDVTGNEAFLSDVLAACEDSEISHVAEDMEVTGEDSVIVLSTCVKGEDDKRYLVIGKLVEISEYS